MFLMPIISPNLGVTEINYVTSVTRTDQEGSLVMPTGIQSGDIIVVCQKHGAYDSSSPVGYDGTNDNGDGFTKITGYYRSPVPYYSGSVAASYKVADGTESGATISGFMAYNTANSLDDNSAAIYVYRPNASQPSVTVNDTYANYQSGGTLSTTVNASSASGAVIVIGFAGTPNTADLSFGVTSDANTVVNNGYADIEVDMVGQRKGAGADVSVSSADGGAHMLISAYLEVT